MRAFVFLGFPLEDMVGYIKSKNKERKHEQSQVPPHFTKIQQDIRSFGVHTKYLKPKKL